jgi:hypothetical protein
MSLIVWDFVEKPRLRALLDHFAVIEVSSEVKAWPPDPQ